MSWLGDHITGVLGGAATLIGGVLACSGVGTLPGLVLMGLGSTAMTVDGKLNQYWSDKANIRKTETANNKFNRNNVLTSLVAAANSSTEIAFADKKSDRSNTIIQTRAEFSNKTGQTYHAKYERGLPEVRTNAVKNTSENKVSDNN